MAELPTLLEQHLDRQPPTAVIQAITWWEIVLALVKLQEGGLGGHLPVKVCYHIHPTCMYFLFMTSLFVSSLAVLHGKFSWLRSDLRMRLDLKTNHAAILGIYQVNVQLHGGKPHK